MDEMGASEPARVEPALSAKKVGAILALAAISAGALIISPVTLLVLVMVLLLVACGELFRLLRHLGVTPLPVVGFVIIAALCVVAYQGPDALLNYAPGVVGGGVVLTLTVRIIRGKVQGALSAIVTTITASVYVGLLGSFIIAMRHTAYGFRLVLVFALMASLNEAAAFFSSRAFGKHPVAPTISATKTWEGVLAGTVASFAVAVIAASQINPPFNASRAFLLAALVSLVMPVGDLAEAAIMREAGIAQSGRALAGHGGVLDRLDGLLFAAPIFYFAARALFK
ncbi:MAG: phosphatidate cytidylyltransferase [Actinomycetota bacterium]